MYIKACRMQIEKLNDEIHFDTDGHFLVAEKYSGKNSMTYAYFTPIILFRIRIY
jgi:hypothetical protein